MHIVLGNPRPPSHEAMKGFGRINVTLSSHVWVGRIEHEQVAFTVKLVHKRLFLEFRRERLLEGRGEIRTGPRTRRNQLLDLAASQPAFVEGFLATHLRAPGFVEPGKSASTIDDPFMRGVLGTSMATARRN